MCCGSPSALLKPPLGGALRLHTTFELPPGDRDVIEKLGLDGESATIASGRFASDEVQQKIAELSHRARGKTSRMLSRKQHVVSQFTGRFRLSHGVLEAADGHIQCTRRRRPA